MFGLSNFSAGLPFSASAWLNPPVAQAAGQVCQQLTTNQWGMHHPNSAPMWGGPTTHIHFWGGQTAPHMLQAPGQQPATQPLTIMAYPSHQPLPLQNFHYAPSLPAPAQPPEQDQLLKCMAQLETTVKSQQEEATNRMAQLETAVKAQQQEAAAA